MTSYTCYHIICQNLPNSGEFSYPVPNMILPLVEQTPDSFRIRYRIWFFRWILVESQTPDSFRIRFRTWFSLVESSVDRSWNGKGENSLAVPAPVRTLLSTSHCHRLFPFLRIFIGFDPIDLSFLTNITKKTNGDQGSASKIICGILMYFTINILQCAINKCAFVRNWCKIGQYWNARPSS